MHPLARLILELSLWNDDNLKECLEESADTRVTRSWQEAVNQISATSLSWSVGNLKFENLFF